MRIGFDVDGVLARFDEAYMDRVVKVTGRNLWKQPVSATYPDVWDWDKAAGYSQEELVKVWADIKRCPIFWRSLLPYRENVEALQRLIAEDEVYYITNRPSITAKQQTEDWLDPWHPRGCPTVLVSANKGAACNALQLDCYIDDRPENVTDVFHNSDTNVFLLDRPWNRTADIRWPARVKSVVEFLQAVGR